MIFHSYDSFIIYEKKTEKQFTFQEIYEIYHNGRRFVAEEVIRHETGANVVMNCAVTSDERRSYLIAGQESHCQMYLVNLKVVDEEEMAKSKPTTEEILRRRKSSTKSSGVETIRSKSIDANANTKHIRFEIQPGDSVQTDFTPTDPLQRVVRISPNGKLMATGGTDGVIRVWKFPRMTKLMEFKKHTKEVDDLDFSPDSKKLVSIAKDGLGVIWDVEKEKEWKKLNFNPPEGIKYLFKRCRFGIYEGKVGKSRLFTIANPFGKVGKQRGYLQAWDPDTGELSNSISVDESLASLAVRDDGRFVAIGSMFSGSVSIYIAFSLQVQLMFWYYCSFQLINFSILFREFYTFPMLIRCSLLDSNSYQCMAMGHQSQVARKRPLYQFLLIIKFAFIAYNIDVRLPFNEIHSISVTHFDFYFQILSRHGWPLFVL